MIWRPTAGCLPPFPCLPSLTTGYLVCNAVDCVSEAIHRPYCHSLEGCSLGVGNLLRGLFLLKILLLLKDKRPKVPCIHHDGNLPRTHSGLYQSFLNAHRTLHHASWNPQLTPRPLDPLVSRSIWLSRNQWYPSHLADFEGCVNIPLTPLWQTWCLLSPRSSSMKCPILINVMLAKNVCMWTVPTQYSSARSSVNMYGSSGEVLEHLFASFAGEFFTGQSVAQGRSV